VTKQMGICAITYEITALRHLFKSNNDKYYTSVYFKNMLLTKHQIFDCCH